VSQQNRFDFGRIDAKTHALLTRSGGHVLRNVCPLLALLIAPACSTITTGTTQAITVTTDPPGATCQVQRDGQLIGVVNPTPGSLTIGKSTRDMVVNCTRSGNLPGSNTVQADFQPATLGNILLGGVVGIVVDAASGAMGTYPPSVAVVLPPAANGVAAAAPIQPAPTAAAEPASGVPTVRPVSTAPAIIERGPPRT
jgi:hypothetical protein